MGGTGDGVVGSPSRPGKAGLPVGQTTATGGEGLGGRTSCGIMGAKAADADAACRAAAVAAWSCRSMSLRVAGGLASCVRAVACMRAVALCSVIESRADSHSRQVVLLE